MSIDDLGTVITSVIAGLGLWLAWSVKDAWKDEKLWTRDTEFRHTLLEKCYEAEANFEKLRRQPPRSRVQLEPLDESKTLSQNSRQLGAKTIFDIYDNQIGF